MVVTYNILAGWYMRRYIRHYQDSPAETLNWRFIRYTITNEIKAEGPDCYSNKSVVRYPEFTQRAVAQEPDDPSPSISFMVVTYNILAGWYMRRYIRHYQDSPAETLNWRFIRYTITNEIKAEGPDFHAEWKCSTFRREGRFLIDQVVGRDRVKGMDLLDSYKGRVILLWKSSTFGGVM
ncbi:uncharacterized protein LOC124358512 [Homalodisca vitripennis]|uniref:uncharacterized protein LOC124358512 n=1 Tax=Homalodisca vitripennis TaxID=197043 RepID=UPI001EEB2BE8|nr:uncharacterized protein LOC124358512 [Homalodisca vitripennis]